MVVGREDRTRGEKDLEHVDRYVGPLREGGGRGGRGWKALRSGLSKPGNCWFRLIAGEEGRQSHTDRAFFKWLRFGTALRPERRIIRVAGFGSWEARDFRRAAFE